MSRYPWFKFYPADWRAEPSLRMVSLEARGFWIECLCIMHEAEPYGHLIVRGVPLEVPAMAAIAGASEQVVRSCLHELEEAGVLSVNKDGVIVSRRMVRDAKNRERARKFGKKGGNPALKKQVASNVYELPLKAPLILRGQKLDTRREANASVETVFDALWKLWPAEARKRHPQQKVRDAIAAQMKLGASPEELLAAGRAHVAERLKSGPNFVKGLVPFLNHQLWKNWAGAGDLFDRAAALRIYREHGYRHPSLTDDDLKQAGANP